MKYYFILALLCYGIYANEQDDWENSTPTSSTVCSKRIDMKYSRCCYVEGKKDGIPAQACKFYSQAQYENLDIEIKNLKLAKWSDDVSINCDKYEAGSNSGTKSETKSDSNSDSKYLKLGILSLLILI